MLGTDTRLWKSGGGEQIWDHPGCQGYQTGEARGSRFGTTQEKRLTSEGGCGCESRDGVSEVCTSPSSKAAVFRGRTQEGTAICVLPASSLARASLYPTSCTVSQKGRSLLFRLHFMNFLEHSRRSPVSLSTVAILHAPWPHWGLNSPSFWNAFWPFSLERASVRPSELCQHGLAPLVTAVTSSSVPICSDCKALPSCVPDEAL